VVESQPSKLLVAGSIPVSRSNLRSRLQATVARHGGAAATAGRSLPGRELRLASLCGQAWVVHADLSAEAARQAKQSEPRKPM
jgi:hypothetical protein